MPHAADMHGGLTGHFIGLETRKLRIVLNPAVQRCLQVRAGPMGRLFCCCPGKNPTTSGSRVVTPNRPCQRPCVLNRVDRISRSTQANRLAGSQSFPIVAAVTGRKTMLVEGDFSHFRSRLCRGYVQGGRTECLSRSPRASTASKLSNTCRCSTFTLIDPKSSATTNQIR